jgi:CDP-diacylglycerol--serine O-phosphatidyltransferase
MKAHDPDASFGPHLRNPANLITFAGLLAGASAVLLAGSAGLSLGGPRMWQVAGLVSLAAAADLADGTVARRLGKATKFGEYLDTLCDAVSYATAPALAAYLVALRQVPVGGYLAAVFWFGCVVARLDRYLLRGHQRTYIGCPAPAGAVGLTLVTAIRPPVLVTLEAALVLSVLMVSGIPVPAPGELMARLAKKARARA